MNKPDAMKERASYRRDPETALIITQNDRGEIVDVEITDFVTGYFIAFHGPNVLEPGSEPYTGPSWWAPSIEPGEGHSEQGSD